MKSSDLLQERSTLKSLRKKIARAKRRVEDVTKRLRAEETAGNTLAAMQTRRILRDARYKMRRLERQS